MTKHTDLKNADFGSEMIQKLIPGSYPPHSDCVSLGNVLTSLEFNLFICKCKMRKLLPSECYCGTGLSQIMPSI